MDVVIPVTLVFYFSYSLAEQQPVGRSARTREYETPRTMKTNFIDKTIKSTIVLSCA